MDQQRAYSGPIRTCGEDRLLRQLRHIREGTTIEQIIEKECGRQGLAKVEIHGGSKQWKVSAGRGRIPLRGREDLALSTAEIARHSGGMHQALRLRLSGRKGGTTAKSTVRNNVIPPLHLDRVLKSEVLK